jgi:RNase P protein component
MKPKTRITEKDYITAMKRANRELEIAMFGKQVSMRGGVKHKSKKAYDRNRMKRNFDF